MAPFVQFTPFVQLADLHPDFVSSIQILFFFVKKNKMKKFPTKMKEKIGAPKGRQLYGAPKGAPIMPNMVVFRGNMGKNVLFLACRSVRNSFLKFLVHKGKNT